MSLFDEVESRVRQRAYEIWQREGCPEGREADHWALAKEEIAIEDNQSQTLAPNPSQGGDDTVVHPEPVEPLLAAESLEEDIGGPTNQSDEQPLPKRTRTRRTVAAGDAEPAPAPSGTAGAAKTTRTRKAKSKE
ncbi:DUF2934 domain-containing protein [Skermanella rosea]|uniref:DUF2934 domain-containing protein n=1 Tax=Skermanella rosea TaxID=1817965 RepID=UPI0019337B5A|nr:DUF2934 domain-containing protein [Skermanella rosea]UEM05696.1 DUF2934 domain-containing protein [Skermanella rosea]